MYEEVFEGMKYSNDEIADMFDKTFAEDVDDEGTSRYGDTMNWGEAGYQNCLDYTKMNEEMQAHKEEILKGYEELSTSIRDCFNQ